MGTLPGSYVWQNNNNNNNNTNNIIIIIRNKMINKKNKWYIKKIKKMNKYVTTEIRTTM